MCSLPLFLSLFLFPAQFDPDPEGIADRILVIYNSNWADENGDGTGDSEEVALYYAKKRRIPAQNLLAVACSPSSYYYSGQSGWEAFWDEMMDPITAYMEQNWDPYSIIGFVFCYGVPYQINAPNGMGARSVDQTMLNLGHAGTRSNPGYITYGHGDPYWESTPTFNTDKGRFDPNRFHYGPERTYLVARLDGRTAEHSKELVEFALYGDAYLSPLPGYYSGTAYCDTRYGAYTWTELDAGYPHTHFSYESADRDMAYGRQWMEQPGFSLRWEPYGTEIGEAGALYEDGSSALTAPDAMFYEGWYNYNKYHDVWEWKVGSAACDLNSNSVARLRQDNPGTFLGEALQKGLTCGPGVIAEPYLNGHPYPEVFMYYLMNGYTFAEAARISDSKSLWRGLYIGDFLYQPMREDKIALLDVTPPPVIATKDMEGTSAGEWWVHTALDNPVGMPDVGELTLRFGSDPTYGQNISGEEARMRVYHRALLTGLGTDELVHYQAEYIDLAGNVGTSEPMVLHTALANQDVLARTYSSSVTVPVGSSFELELVFGATAGFDTLTQYSATVTANHLGWTQRDLFPLLQALGATVYESATGTVKSVRATAPSTLSAGTYLVEVSATSSAGMDSDSLTITVQ